MKATFTSATCATCNTDFDRIPVDYDEDGQGYVAIPVKQCPTCAALLCPCCPTFSCDGCNQTFCTSHLVTVPDGKYKPLLCCAQCATEVEVLPLAKPVQPELRPCLVAARSSVEVA